MYSVEGSPQREWFISASDGEFSSSNSNQITFSYESQNRVCFVEDSGREERSFLLSGNGESRWVAAARPLQWK